MVDFLWFRTSLRPWRWTLQTAAAVRCIAVVGLFAVSCGSSSGGAGSSEADVPTLTDVAGTVDVGEIAAPGGIDAGGGTKPGGVEVKLPEDFGQPCSDNTECESNWCVDSYKSKVCTDQCTENCPEGWVCSQITNTFPDVTFVCIPTVADLCKTCNDSKQCGAAGDVCLPIGDEGKTHCATACTSNASCPSGFVCEAAAGGSFCLPVSGSCTCDADSSGSSQPCSVVNEIGECGGVRQCLGESGWGACNAATPVVEICNGVDDDCDGVVDQGMAEVSCESTNEWGSCLGTQICYGAAGWACNAPTALPEACNGVDDNCDGQVDEVNAIGCEVYYLDADQDGVGLSSEIRCQCGPVGLYTAKAGGDCDDQDAEVGALGLAEICTPSGGVPQDENCDGQIDEPGAEGCEIWFIDADGDGFGNDASAACLCASSGAFTTQIGGDCDDASAAVNPLATEVCNGVDDNCDGITDPVDAQSCVAYYKDADNDGVGVDGESICACGPSFPFTSPLAGDCDDANNTVYPGAQEKCNGLDDNCDGETDELGALGCATWHADSDGDGFGTPDQSICTCAPPGAGWSTLTGDCDDDDSGINPAAQEECSGFDNNCNGLVDEEGASGCTTYYFDQDGDGYGILTNTKCLCAPDAPYSALMAGDCQDTDAEVYPFAQEACNGKDDNCNGQVDEEGAAGCSLWYFDGDGDGVGLTVDSKCLCGPVGAYTTQLAGDCDDADASVGPGGVEICNGQDDDCDGVVDQPGAAGCLPYYVDADGDGFGNPDLMQCLCASTEEYPAPWPGDCNDDDPLVYPGALEPCASAEDCCAAGWSCVYDVCVASTPPCSTNGDCVGDSYCDNGICVPYKVGPADAQDDCVKAPKIGLFSPAIQCAWTGPPPGDAYPSHRQVLGTPLVVDFDFDSDPNSVRPSIVFVSYNGSDGGFAAASSNGIVRIIDGETCVQQYSVDVAKVVGSASLAVADLDLAPDGRPEIVAFREGGGLIAFRYDPAADFFQLHWVSTTKAGAVSTLAADQHRWAGPTLADITGDEHPEILMGSVLHSHEGRIIADNLGYRQLTGTNTGDFDVVADVDLDGEPELVRSDGIYRYQGDATNGTWVLESYWKAVGNPAVFVAVADFGNYPVAGLPAGIPEIVAVGNGQARIMRLDGTTLFGPYALPTFVSANPGYGGPPTIGDFDGDGLPEFAAAGLDAYTVFDPGCVGTPLPLGCTSPGVLWKRQMQDASSNRTGSSVFDFEADGLAEVVYADECFVRVYDGLTGDVLYSQTRSSCTWYENPIVADTDGDLRSEIVVGANTNCNVVCPPIDPVHRGQRCETSADCPGGTPSCVTGYCRCKNNADCGEGSGNACVAPLPNTPGQGNVCRAAFQGATQGIIVYRDVADAWVNSRPIWHQHTYSITDVTDQGRIRPRADVVPNWLAPGFNNFRQNAQGEGDPTLSGDITIDPGVLLNCDASGSLNIPILVCNRGAAPVGQGIPVGFFAGNPDLPSSKILCLEKTTSTIPPGECAPLNCSFAPAPGAAVDIWVFGDFGGTQGVVSECLEQNNYAVFPKVTCNNLK